MIPHADDTLALYQILATSFFIGPCAFLLGGVIWLAFERAIPRRNRRVVCVMTRMRTPASEQPPPIVSAGENQRVRTVN